MIQNALVVGGGVGGMSAAIALAEKGVAVHLIDADPQWKVYGAGISVTGLSLRAFEALGILDQVREHGFVSAGIRLRTPDGGLIMEAPVAPNPAPIQSSGGIMRPVLHQIMQRRVAELPIEVSLGVKSTAFTESDDGVEVTLSNGRRVETELVIAADGIFSQTRQQLFPEAPAPLFTGQGCWRLVAPRPPEIDRPEMYLGGPVKLGLNPVSRDEMYLFVLEHVPDNPYYQPEEMVAHLAKLLAPFGGAIEGVRASLGPNSQINYRPLEWILMPPPWYKGRVVLIGDAAHATTPHMASGAGVAAEDALVIAEEVTRHANVADAMEAFMSRRFERARMVVENSVRIGEIEMAGGDQRDANAMLGGTMHKLQEPY